VKRDNALGRWWCSHFHRDHKLLGVSRTGNVVKTQCNRCLRLWGSNIDMRVTLPWDPEMDTFFDGRTADTSRLSAQAQGGGE
jgi:hypothetical protein